ncbi:MAG: histidine kinase [Selenomonadaceae bacterium]|nr:histidine kinase [Selenomonadaceae bacterium]
MMALMISGLIVSVVTPDVTNWNRKFFITLFTILTLVVISYFVDLLASMYSSEVVAEKIAAFLEYISLPVIMLMFTVFLLHSCGEEWRRSKFFYSMLILGVTFLILLTVTQFTEIFYYVTAENIFYRTELHFILMLPLCLMAPLNLFAVARRRKILSRKYFTAFMVNTSPMTFAMLFHTAIFNPIVVALGVTFSALGMFIIILLDHVEQFLRQQREIFNQQANILVLQMRPHFIYNTMTSIYYLCSQNSELAQKVILDFTNYLRKNFMAIACEGTISFSEELEHTKAYLAIEQAQFEENLFVKYDTPHQNFKIPPLTLQPIVENCVKHGLDPDSEPLHILISTRETDAGSVIVVEDDGVGFNFGDGGENFALKNIQKRLEMFCNGTLEIYPREGDGTVVKILVNSK